jgi:hypothetical protein
MNIVIVNKKNIVFNKMLFLIHYLFLRFLPNVLQLGEVTDLQVLTFILAQIFIRNPNVQFSTEPAILPNCC